MAKYKARYKVGAAAFDGVFPDYSGARVRYDRGVDLIQKALKKNGVPLEGVPSEAAFSVLEMLDNDGGAHICHSINISIPAAL